MVALTEIEPEGCQFRSVQLGLSGCVFSAVGIPGWSETPPRIADVVTWLSLGARGWCKGRRRRTGAPGEKSATGRSRCAISARPWLDLSYPVAENRTVVRSRRQAPDRFDCRTPQWCGDISQTRTSALCLGRVDIASQHLGFILVSLKPLLPPTALNSRRGAFQHQLKSYFSVP
jgi:hypothetical protein